MLNITHIAGGAFRRDFNAPDNIRLRIAMLSNTSCHAIAKPINEATSAFLKYDFANKPSVLEDGRLLTPTADFISA